MRKFNRVYQLKVETAPGLFTSPLRNPDQINANVTINQPYAIEFEISRQNLTSAQTGTFRLYNLPPETRDAIGKDIYQTNQLRAVQFWAGYANETGYQAPQVFNGTVNTAYSFKEGQEWITEIQSYDGGFQIANGSNFIASAAPGLSAGEAIAMLARSLPNLAGNPIIGSYPVTNKRTEVFFGNTWSLIQKKANGTATIDNGQVKALNFSECFRNAGLPLVDDSSGLIGTPQICDTTMDVTMLFEPALSVGQIIEVRFASLPKLKRYWKVLGFQHSGKITQFGQVGEATTRVRLWYNHEDLTVVAGQPFLNPLLIA